VARLSADDVDPDDQAAFDAWLLQSPANDIAFEQALSAWERGQQLRANAPAAGPHRIRPTGSPDRRSARRYRLAPRQIAASFAAAAMIVAVTGYALTAPPAYATAVGERRLVLLRSGVRIELNTDSKIIVRERAGQVLLVKGEARLQLPGGRSHPFTVVAARPGRDVDVTIPNGATSLAVRLRATEVDVLVDQGGADVSTEGDARSAHLRTGFRGVFSDGRSFTQQMSADEIERLLAWRNGNIVLAGETVEQAAQEFNRYNLQQLVVTDPSVAGLRVGGYFRADDPVGFAKALGHSFGVRMRQDGNTIYLARAT